MRAFMENFPGWRALIWFFPAAFLLLFVSGDGEAASAGRSPVRVVVSILPEKFFVERVGGEHAAVSVMVGKGKNHETYEPTPRQMADVSEASLYFRIGLPFEDIWLERMTRMNPALRVVDLRKGISIRAMTVDEGGGEHAEAEQGKPLHTDTDPHIWLSPANVVLMAVEIRDALSEADPARREFYHRRAEAFANELKTLDGVIRAGLKGIARPEFAVFHPSWGYFADAYGLKQLAIEQDGKEPGARALAGFIDRARAAGIRTVFVQSQAGSRNAQTVASALGGRVVEIDALAEDYLSNMKSVAGIMAREPR